MVREELLKSAKPILFNTEMVRAILDGRKTVTRRVVKPQHLMVLDSPYHETHPEVPNDVLIKKFCEPPYHPEDILYVRETWGISNLDYDNKVAFIVYRESENKIDEGCRAVRIPNDKFEKLYDSMAENSQEWRPSIHMPKETARIFLRVTDVRVERLQDITEEQAQKEGIPDSLGYPVDKIYCPVCNGSGFVGGYNSTSLGFEEEECQNCDTAVKRFKNLWNSTIKKSDLDRYGWDASPWVWVIEFERVMADENTD